MYTSKEEQEKYMLRQSEKIMKDMGLKCITIAYIDSDGNNRGFFHGDSVELLITSGGLLEAILNIIKKAIPDSIKVPQEVIDIINNRIIKQCLEVNKKIMKENGDN